MSCESSKFMLYIIFILYFNNSVTVHWQHKNKLFRIFLSSASWWTPSSSSSTSSSTSSKSTPSTSSPTATYLRENKVIQINFTLYFLVSTWLSIQLLFENFLIFIQFQNMKLNLVRLKKIYVCFLSPLNF